VDRASCWRTTESEDAEVAVNTVGVLARFTIQESAEGEMAAFFAAGRAIVDDEPSTTTWVAFRVDEVTYGAFATFADPADREALLARGGPRLSQEMAQLFVAPPTFEKVDLLEVRMPPG
jgi:hypothetical protein